MKRINYLSFCLIVMGLNLVSCKKEVIASKDLGNSTVENIPAKRGYIYYATWDSWGRGSQDCGSWGLCNYTDCWFCEVDDGGNHFGEIIFDEETKEGNLVIKLDFSEQIQKDAINNKSPFYVDYDIDNKNSILRKGIYLFDDTIGEYGGYNVRISIK